MSDRIIRAAQAQRFKTWMPAAVNAAGSAAASAQPFAAVQAVKSVDAPGVDAKTLELQLQRAHEAGHAAGYLQGLEQGRAEVSQQAALEDVRSDEDSQALLQALDQSLQAFEKNNAAVLQQLPVWLTEMALGVAKKMLQQPSAENDAALLKIMQKSVEQLRQELQANCTVHAHPVTCAAVKKKLSASQSTFLNRLCADDSVTEGGFVIRHQEGVLDFTMEARWKQVVETFCSDLRLQVWKTQ
jgi:flagellar biosynthesis/type III secretory pathway protein FliH